MSYKKLFQNSAPIFTMTVVSVIGILSGVLLARHVGFSYDGLFLTEDKPQIFFNGFIPSLTAIIVIALGSSHILLSPLIFSTVFVKALFYGFSSGASVKMNGFEGLLRVSYGMGIYNFLIFVLMIVYSSAAFTKNAECFLNRENFSFKKRSGKAFLLYTLAAIAASALIASAEAVIGASRVLL